MGNSPSVKIFVIYHKKDILFKSDLLEPIHAGRELALSASKDGKLSQKDFDWICDNMIGDDTGDNISILNRDFNEMSAIYWIWKNYKTIGNMDFVGISHYRRLWYLADIFQNNPEGSLLEKISLSKENIISLLGDSDLILPNLYCDKSITFGEFQQYFRFSEGNFPEMFKWYKIFEEDHKYYGMNMFIVARDVFFDYCEYIFDVLFQTQKFVQDNNISVFPRYYGVASEYLTSFYFMNLLAETKLKAKEMPIVYLDPPRAIKV